MKFRSILLVKEVTKPAYSTYNYTYVTFYMKRQRADPKPDRSLVSRDWLWGKITDYKKTQGNFLQ